MWPTASRRCRSCEARRWDLHNGSTHQVSRKKKKLSFSPLMRVFYFYKLPALCEYSHHRLRRWGHGYLKNFRPQYDKSLMSCLLSRNGSARWRMAWKRRGAPCEFYQGFVAHKHWPQSWSLPGNRPQGTRSQSWRWKSRLRRVIVLYFFIWPIGANRNVRFNILYRWHATLR